MYKCLDCGHIFDDGEQDVIREYHREIPGGFYEEFAGCPICGGDFEETERCEKCGGAFLPDELISGYYCKDCLREALNAESFLEFATTGVKSDTEIDTLEDFIFIKVFGLPKAPNVSTPSLKVWCGIIYDLMDKAILTAAIFAYMDSLPSLWECFAEYLYDKEVKK